MRKEQFYKDKKAVKRSVSGICLAPFLALQITGCGQTADQDETAQKTEQAQGTEKGGTRAERNSAETEKSDSGTGEVGREQSAGNSQAGAKVATGQGDSMVELKPSIPIKERVAAPNFTGKLMGSTSVTLSELQGKPAIVNLWATWCGPRVKEMPAFERLKDNFGNKVGIIAVNCGGDTETVKGFVKENGHAFLVVLNEEYSISMLYPTNSIPYTVVLDAEGKVTHTSTGALNADTMYGRCKEALGV